MKISKVKHLRLWAGAMLWLLAVSAWSQERAEQIRERLLDRDLTSVIVVAHRADWRNFPENSLAAIQSAIDMGVDMVELDLQRTRDGELILMHDATLDRTTTGRGRVEEWTLDSIRTLYLKNGCGIRTRHRVPTLEEALRLARGKVMINLDKADRYFDQVYELLEKTGTTRQIVMKGSRPAAEVRALYGKYLDRVIYMPVVNLDKPGAREQVEAFVRAMQPAAFELLYARDDNPLPRQLARSLRGKSLIWYNLLWDTLAGGHDDDRALNDPDREYGYLVDSLGCRILQTDRPAFLLDYLRRRGLHE